MSWGLLAVVVAWAAIIVYRRRHESAERGADPSPRARRAAGNGAGRAAHGDDPDIDRDELEAAEREVKDLETDVRGRPLDDQVGDDWGPGTPKPPYV